MTTIALIGPDGAGKTTLARRLENESTLPPVKRIYLGSNLEHADRPLPTTRVFNALRRLRGGGPGVGGPPDPAAKKRRRPGFGSAAIAELRALAHVAILVAEEWYRQALAWWYQQRGFVVLFDRHVCADYPVERLRSRGRGRIADRIHAAALDRWYPRPDRWILLDAPADVLFSRKHEGRPELLEQRRRDFFRLRGGPTPMTVIDVSRPLDEVWRDVRGVVAALAPGHGSARTPEAGGGRERSESGRGDFSRRAESSVPDPRFGGLASDRSRGRPAAGQAPACNGKRRFLERMLGALERLDRHRPNSLRVLMYHRVLDEAAFAGQMEHLAEHHHVVSVPEVLEAYDRRRPLPPRSVLITFDDAYRDFAECAWPHLRSRKLPAVLFVPTAFPDHPERVFWWDRLEHSVRTTERRDAIDTSFGRVELATPGNREHAFRSLRSHMKSLEIHELEHQVQELMEALRPPPLAGAVLGWNDLRGLARDGVTLGAHTRTHPFLDRLLLPEAEEEVFGSLQDLEREVGRGIPLFAYPDGRYDPELVEALRRSRFALAFTTRKGTNLVPSQERLTMRRIPVGPRDDVLALRAKLIASGICPGPGRPLLEQCACLLRGWSNRPESVPPAENPKAMSPKRIVGGPAPAGSAGSASSPFTKLDIRRRRRRST